MLQKIDKVLAQIILFIINSTILLALLIYQIIKNSTNSSLLLIFFFLLIIQLILTIILAFKNIIAKNIKALSYLILSTLIAAELYMTFIFVGAITLGLGVTTSDYKLHDFNHSETCNTFNTDSIKTKIEDIAKNKFASDFDTLFIEQLKIENIQTPLEITKINCGCRITDSSEIVFRIWDSNDDTYELEMIKDNDKYKFKKIYQTPFE